MLAGIECISLLGRPPLAFGNMNRLSMMMSSLLLSALGENLAILFSASNMLVISGHSPDASRIRSPLYICGMCMCLLCRGIDCMCPLVYVLCV